MRFIELDFIGTGNRWKSTTLTRIITNISIYMYISTMMFISNEKLFPYDVTIFELDHPVVMQLIRKLTHLDLFQMGV